jgi:hypothetical protein
MAEGSIASHFLDNSLVSSLIVKDRMTGNNPVAALHGWHLSRLLFGKGRWEKRRESY